MVLCHCRNFLTAIHFREWFLPKLFLLWKISLKRFSAGKYCRCRIDMPTKAEREVRPRYVFLQKISIAHISLCAVSFHILQGSRLLPATVTYNHHLPPVDLGSVSEKEASQAFFHHLSLLHGSEGQRLAPCPQSSNLAALFQVRASKGLYPG